MTAGVFAPQLSQPDGPGCALFVYSVMLTRTLPGVMSDFDTALGASARLISAHNYAAQVRVCLIVRVRYGATRSGRGARRSS